MSCTFYYDYAMEEIMKNVHRKKETAERYIYDREHGLVKNLWDEEVVYENEFYKVIKNRYPYDRAYAESLLLITKESVGQALVWAKQYAEANGFHTILWNTKLKSSIQDINHVHILKEYE